VGGLWWSKKELEKKWKVLGYSVRWLLGRVAVKGRLGRGGGDCEGSCYWFVSSHVRATLEKLTRHGEEDRPHHDVDSMNFSVKLQIVLVWNRNASCQ
jgi:hypothetical protein